jgi:dUTPase
VFFSEKITMKIKIVNKSKHRLPAYKTEILAGIDNRELIERDMISKMIIDGHERAYSIEVDLPEVSERGTGEFCNTGNK